MKRAKIRCTDLVGWPGSSGQADPAAESCSNRQEKDGACRGFARCVFARRGS